MASLPIILLLERFWDAWTTSSFQVGTRFKQDPKHSPSKPMVQTCSGICICKTNGPHKQKKNQCGTSTCCLLLQGLCILWNSVVSTLLLLQKILKVKLLPKKEVPQRVLVRRQHWWASPWKKRIMDILPLVLTLFMEEDRFPVQLCGLRKASPIPRFDYLYNKNIRNWRCCLAINCI